MNSPEFLASAWSFSPGVAGFCLAGMAWYCLIFGLNPRMVWFVAGMLVLFLTLLSPLNALADGYLFSAHMAQHILLLLVVPAFWLLGMPRWPSSFCGTLSGRNKEHSFLQKSSSSRFRSHVLGFSWRHPLLGWFSGVGAMWFWHVPVMCNSAVQSPLVHTFQTASLLVCGLAFWRLILSPRQTDRLAPVGAVLYLFSACVTCSVLGIIITLSPVTVCSVYTMPPVDHLAMLRVIRTDWGMTPQRDQQIGGLLMWVPMCLIYLCAIFSQIARWYAEPAEEVKASYERI